MKKPVVSALLVLVAVAIYVSAVCAQPREEIKLTTIIPDQQVLRVKKGIVSTTNYRQATFPDANIPASSLLVEGNVGIGTTGPVGKLEINNSLSNSTYSLIVGSDTMGRGIQVNTSDYVLGSAGTALRIGMGAGIGDTYADINSLYQGTSARNLVLNQSGGNVGIGTNNPDATLEVKGTMKVFGAWESKAKDTVYRAATDGFVSAIGTASTGWTDSNNPPMTQRTSSSNFDGQCFMPVRKGDYWKITGDAHTVYWLPLGS